MFLTNLSVSASSDPGNDFWFSPVNNRSISGAMVSPDRALQFSTVYKCIKVYYDTLGMLPRHLYEAGTARKRVTSHPVAKLLTAPNRWQTPAQFFGMLEAHKQLRGNGYAEILYDRKGQPSELVPLHPDRVMPEIGPSGLPRWIVKDAQGLNPRTLVQGEVMHLTGLTVDGYTGVNPVMAEREAIGAAIASRDYGSRYWNNDARPPFWIKVPAKFENNEARAGFRDDWQAAYGGGNQHRPAVLDRGMEIVELSIDNQTAQWMDARKYSDTDLCGLWRMPPHKIGILTDAKYANIEQQSIEFVTDTILPQLVGWEQVFARDLLLPDEGLYLENLVNGLLRGDTKSRYEAYGKGIQDGWLTRNEVRRMENMAPLDGLDEPLQPLNMTQAGGKLLSPPKAMPERAVALLHANAARVARKEVALLRGVTDHAPGAADAAIAEAFVGHERFVADVMAVGLDTATQYTAQAVGNAQRLHAQGPLQMAAWIETQTAALVRLES